MEPNPLLYPCLTDRHLFQLWELYKAERSAARAGEKPSVSLLAAKRALECWLADSEVIAAEALLAGEGVAPSAPKLKKEKKKDE